MGYKFALIKSTGISFNPFKSFQNKVNEWLLAHPDIEITNISTCCYASEGYMTTILYKEKD